jgi:hypothetical protein
MEYYASTTRPNNYEDTCINWKEWDDEWAQHCQEQAELEAHAKGKWITTGLGKQAWVRFE